MKIGNPIIIAALAVSLLFNWMLYSQWQSQRAATVKMHNDFCQQLYILKNEHPVMLKDLQIPPPEK
jgi:hypothetical protein